MAEKLYYKLKLASNNASKMANELEFCIYYQTDNKNGGSTQGHCLCGVQDQAFYGAH